MRKVLYVTFLSLVLLIFFTPAICSAITVDFYSNDVITGGTYDVIRLHDDAIINMTGGTIRTYVELYDTSTFNVNGGILVNGANFMLFDTSIINLHNLTTETLGNRIQAVSGAKINIFGYGFYYVGNTLNGYWENNQPFSLYIRDASTKSMITLTETPEPSSCLLLMMGGFLLRKFKK